MCASQSLIVRIAPALAFLSFIGCKASQAPPQADPSVDDHSLTISEYIELGMPTIDRDWTEDDYANAAVCIKRISEEKPLSLPRFNSAKSGRLFERLINTDILFQLRNDELSVKKRIAIAEKGFDAFGDCATNYAKLANLPYVKETWRLFGAFLRTFEYTTEFYERMSKRLDIGDLTAIDMKGLRKHRLDKAPRLLGSVLEIFANNRVRDPEDHLDFISIARGPFAQIFAQLSPEKQKPILDRIDQMIATEADQRFREKLEDFRAGVIAKK